MFDFDLTSVLEEDTIVRSEFSEPKEEEEDDFSDLEFGDDPDDDEDSPGYVDPEQAKTIVFTDADAKEGAEILVDMIDTANTMIMTPLGRWKLAKKRGGKVGIARMQEIAEKNFAGTELSEQEKRLLYQYNAYLADKEQMEKDIPYTEEEKKRLIKSAIPMIKKMKWKVGGGGSFAMELVMIQGSRVMQILTA